MKMKSAGVVDGGLFTESYCNICNAQLISESQRTAHYEVSPSGGWKPSNGGGPSDEQIPAVRTFASALFVLICVVCSSIIHGPTPAW